MATIACFHAHPDDEALLTGGTIARLAAEGHRVLIVMATDGSLGQATKPAQDASDRSRLDELADSAKVLGAAQVRYLGYADSGHGPTLYPDPADRQRFVRADIDEAATRLASILREAGATLLLSYDETGGYGHRDHVRVHQVGRRAAEMTGVRLLEARLPRRRLAMMFRFMRLMRLFSRSGSGARRAAPVPSAAVTHRLKVRRYARQKQAALAAHKSQIGAGRAGRLFWVLTHLPVPVYGALLGRECYSEPGSDGAAVVHDHVI